MGGLFTIVMLKRTTKLRHRRWRAHRPCTSPVNVENQQNKGRALTGGPGGMPAGMAGKRLRKAQLSVRRRRDRRIIDKEEENQGEEGKTTI